MKHYTSSLAGLLALCTSATICGQGITVLESFEDNIDSVSLMDWGGRPALDPVGVALEHYTRVDASDIHVTHGDKSLKVTLSGSEWWSADFQVTLSAEASDLLREAVVGGNVAQYILRWDYVFPPEGTTSWMNSQIQGFGGNYDQLENNNGMRTMSIPLDVATPLPDGQLVLQFAQNFDATEDPFVSLDIYLDNIRLVDTYVPDASPKVYLLQSFENENDPTGGAANFTDWGGGQRTTYAQYTATDPDDVRVSDGTHSLEVTYSGSGAWGSDFIIPFASTMLADVLRLDLPAEERPTPAELARYTLRFDTVYPDSAEIGATWMNTSYTTLQQDWPWSQTANFGGRRTCSITLDQTAWADWTSPTPVIMVMANSDWTVEPVRLYFDNFVLIDTGDTSGVPAPVISDGNYDPGSGEFTLSWSSSGAATYAIERAEDAGGTWTAIAEDLAGEAGTTSYTDTAAPVGSAFYRVVAFPPPPLYETGFEPGEDLTGWTEVITVGETQWEVGIPTSGPGSAHNGVNVLATKLAGDYDVSQEVGYRSPVIDLTGRDSATLEFYTYYDFEVYEGAAMDWGNVYLLDAATGQNLLPGDATALHFERAYLNWRRVSYPLPSEALGRAIRIEFRLFSDLFDGRPGWYIDDLRVQ